MKRPVAKEKPPVKQVDAYVPDGRGFVPSPSGGRVRRIRAVE